MKFRARKYRKTAYSQGKVLRNCLLLFFSFSFLCLNGQRRLNNIGYRPLNNIAYRDSLIGSLQAPLSPHVKGENCLLLSQYFIEEDSATAMKYLVAGRKMLSDDPYLLLVAKVYEANIFSIGNADTAMSIYRTVEAELKKYTTPDAYAKRSMCWHNYAKMVQRKDDTKQYVDILLNKAIPLAQKANDTAYLGKNYLDVAFGFKNLTEFSRSEDYLLKAITTLKTTKDGKQFLASAYHTLSENYTLSGKLPQAAAMLDSMRKIIEPYPQSDLWLDYYAGNAMRLTVEEKFDASLVEIGKGISLAKKLKQDYAAQRLLLQKFYALYNKKELKSALSVALNLERLQPFMSTATNRLQIYYGLAQTYKGMHNLSEGYKWLELYANLNDTISKSNLLKEVNVMDARFQTSEKEKKIEQLEAEKKQQALKAKNQRLNNLLLGIAAISFFIIAAFFVFYYRNTKKLSEQKEINYKQQLKDIQQQQELKLTQAMLEGEERERMRLARDLHDGLGGMLAGVKINLSRQSKMEGAHLDVVIGQIDQSVSELRRIARNMMPESLLKIGLEAALRDLCEFLSDEKTLIEFQAYNIDADLPVSVQVNIYRIVQEILSNAIRHAEAGKVILQCSQNGEVFYITAEDNGKGFDISLIDKTQGIGFSNIKSRVEYMKGSIDVTSGINEGTVINIELYVSQPDNHSNS